MSSENLTQIEPDHGNEFVPRPFSLTPAELGDLAVSMASAPTPVLAWVRYPAIAVRVQGLVVAWTSRAVYVEWEDRGTHRVWVWASAVERALDVPAADQAASKPPAVPDSPRTPEMTALGTAPLVKLVNAELELIGAEFLSAMAKPAGPFGAVVFGSIDGHRVRLDFHVEPASSMCAVFLTSTHTEDLPGASSASTFDEAIEAYPWAAVLEALELD
ncbi:hypothetical protein [Cryobacterium roopkundense]|uniref:Uncharacterized protein n=1 Tax=Cryobacterium roopkundense TaxID=1001240 RepID=A0A7W9A0G6_9MICO|nr:hypothetical protein [Cryobacterium roopkundense]MBB5643531.1 hypothetical protein [Cryobacterium roopkundense]